MLYELPPATWGRLRPSVVTFLTKVRGTPADDLGELIGQSSSIAQLRAQLDALVNDADSPAAGLADMVIPLHAGPERSVAATKSYVGSLMAITHLVAEWTQDNALDRALDGAEEQLETNT